MSKKNNYKISGLEKKITIVDIFLQIILFIFSYIIPKNKKMLVFGSGAGYIFDGNPKYLYLYALKNKLDFEIYWITKNKDIFKSLKDKNYPVLNIYSIKGFLGILRAKYLINDHSSKDISYILSLFGRFNTLQTWHGTPLKKLGISLFKDTNSYNGIKQYLIKREYKKDIYICSPSKYVSKIFKKVFNNNNKIPITGYPRNDIFFDENLIQSNIKDELNIKNYKKVITYAPTFRDNNNISPFSEKFLFKLNNLCKKNDYIFILKLHPFDQSLLYNFDNFTNIIKVSKNIDLQELLFYTEILITDYSSVFFDFMNTKKPIIYYSYDYELYMKDRGMFLNYYKEIPGPFIQNENDLIKSINNTDKWFKNKNYQEKYKYFNDKFNYYKDGKSSERVFNYIINKLGKKL